MVHTEDIHIEACSDGTYRKVFYLSNGAKTIYKISKEDFDKEKELYLTYYSDDHMNDYKYDFTKL